jgi:hypothetical protein
MTTPTMSTAPVSGDPEQVRRISAQLAAVEARALEVVSRPRATTSPTLGLAFPFGPAATGPARSLRGCGRIHPADRRPRYRGASHASTTASIVPIGTRCDSHEHRGRPGRSPLAEGAIDVQASAETTIQDTAPAASAAIVTENP